MQKVNIKNLLIFNSFYLLFCFVPHVCIGNSNFRICGVCLVVVASETSSHHTHIILPQHFTDNFSLHTTRYTHATPS